MSDIEIEGNWDEIEGKPLLMAGVTMRSANMTISHKKWEVTLQIAIFVDFSNNDLSHVFGMGNKKNMYQSKNDLSYMKCKWRYW